MISDSITFSATSVGTLINLLGLFVPLVIFGAIIGKYKESYFRYWAANYLLTFVSLSAGLYSTALGHPFALEFVFGTCFIAGSAVLFAAANDLAGEKVPKGKLAWVTALMCLIYTALTLAHQPMPVTSILPVIMNMAGHVTLGRVLLRRYRTSGGAPIELGLGICTIFTGLWALAYPVLLTWHIVWVGYAVAGVNHVVMGLGLAVLLLESAARRLREQNEALATLDRLKDEFLATMSHELRTPLTAVKTSAWLIRRGLEKSADANLLEVLESMEKGAEGLTTMIQDLLDFSRLESGRMVYDCVPGDIVDAIEDVKTQFKGIFQVRKLELVSELPEELAAFLDWTKLRQILSNLLANAAKFTPEGGSVYVRLQQVGDSARIEVSDTGIGIAKDQLETIFLRFHQVDGTSTRRFGGAGLGLAICRAIIENGFGGRIWAESELGHGSTFVLVFPLTSVEVPALIPPLPLARVNPG